MLVRARFRQIPPAALVFCISLTPMAAAAPHVDGVTPQERDFFESRIRPVLVRHCFECHSHEADTLASDYAVDSRKGLRGGGASGEAAVAPGEPDRSRLLHALRYDDEILQMPPEGRLPDEVIADFTRWVAMGAPDPRTEDPEALRRQAQQAAAGELWSLQAPVQPDVPRVQDVDWPRAAIDHFILSRLEREGLHPVADADPGKLLRRVYFDLIGLPPRPEDVAALVADPTRAAFERVVDKLLESPRFGERWGRHWLDLARYAESSGMEFNFTYPHAWPYRDYVIDALNKDKPYHRFIIEQLAGDLLPAASKQERDENRLATGFLAIGPKRHNAGARDFRMDVVDDQIRATTEAFLGLTVGCARCHDHKFDPIPTEDYYALAGIFLSTETLHGTTKIKYSRHPSDLVAFGPDARKRHERFVAHQQKLRDVEKSLGEKEAELQELKGEERKQVEMVVASLKQKAKRLRGEAPQPPVYGMGAAEGEPADTRVAVGGDPGNKGDTVARGFLSNVAVKDAPPVTEKSSGRWELARWIASRENPLTARVMVNRIWRHLFGRGLVSSVNNFGVLGRRPSHPRLLDYLAVQFMDDGWSVKKLIRSVVLSRAYQLSTRKDDHNFQLDPNNHLVWRMAPRRLEVEPLRDAVLAVSGQLDIRRPQGSSVTALGQQLARAVSWDRLNPASNHRTVYLPVVRHYESHMLQEFDFAASSLVVGDRAETTTSQQALFFLNNDFMLEQAEAAAKLLRAQSADATRQLRIAYLRTLSRLPTEAELSLAQEFLRRTENKLREKYPDPQERHAMALAGFVQALFGSAEFRYLIHAPAVASTMQPDLTKVDYP